MKMISISFVDKLLGFFMQTKPQIFIMLSITLVRQKCNNLIRDSQFFLTYQNNFKSEKGLKVSLVCYAESIFSSYESFYDVTNNFNHKFFNALSNTKSKYIQYQLKKICNIALTVVIFQFISLVTKLLK